MRVVTVIALHQPFVHLVTERTVELLLNFLMTAVTQLRRLLFHQELAFFCGMGRMAVDTAHVVLQVGRSPEIAVFFPIGMTGQAAVTDFLCGSILEGKNLGLVPATLDMLLAWPVASFAAVPFWPLLRVERGHKVGRVLIALVEALRGHVFVTGFADLGAHIL